MTFWHANTDIHTHKTHTHTLACISPRDLIHTYAPKEKKRMGRNRLSVKEPTKNCAMYKEREQEMDAISVLAIGKCLLQQRLGTYQVSLCTRCTQDMEFSHLVIY